MVEDVGSIEATASLAALSVAGETRTRLSSSVATRAHLS